LVAVVDGEVVGTTACVIVPNFSHVGRP
jgi:hypothetical protein